MTNGAGPHDQKPKKKAAGKKAKREVAAGSAKKVMTAGVKK